MMMLKKLRPALSLFAFLTFTGLALLLINCGGGTGTSSSSTQQPASTPPQAASSSHVAIVLLENASYSDVIGSSSMPYLNSLASQYALATNYFANAHPSLPNYFMLSAGQTVTSDDNYTGTVSADNIVRELNAAGRSWKAYAEDLPSVGYLGGDTGNYIRHHNPFTYFSDVQNSAPEQQNIVPFSQLATDLGSNAIPNFSFIAPNALDDAHSCPTGNPSCSLASRLATADAWLRTNVAPLLGNATFAKDGVLVIVFDESAASDLQNGGGHVAMVLAGPAVKNGYRSTTLYQHQSTLRTMLNRLGILTYPGAAASAPDMSEFFTK
jgi:phosphatidylinositol-3-phosphatase